MGEVMFGTGNDFVRTLGVRMARLMTVAAGGIRTMAENVAWLVASTAGVDFTGISDVIGIVFDNEHVESNAVEWSDMEL